MENLKVYVDRLKGGVSHKVDETLPPDFLEVDDEELLFDDPVKIQCEVYLAEEHLVVHLNIDTSVHLPCSICNDAIVEWSSKKNSSLETNFFEEWIVHMPR